MSAPEIDPVTGRSTTGHEWNGIKELGTPVPRIVFIALALGTVYLIVWTILMPAWPTVSSYTRGILGIDQRTSVAEQVALARQERAPWTSVIENKPLEALVHDPEVMGVVASYGRTLFGDNCQGCHGATGAGNRGFPNISAAPLMWGDSLEAVHETIRVGINSTHAETRFAQMLAFGRDGMLSRGEVLGLLDYLTTLSEGVPSGTEEQASEVFALNCASCHGEDARGLTDFGAPNLVDAHWIYGGTRQAIFDTIWSGRTGHMPHWEDRLSAADIKILALYVHQLRENAQ